MTALPLRIRSKIRLDDPPPGRPVIGPCWIWTGSHTSKHYGQVTIAGKRWLVHRLTYTTLVGPIPPGLQSDHLCRVHACCNPCHIEPVTNLENALRGERATKTHCIRNHPLSGDNLIFKKVSERGHRRCRACWRLKTAEAAERKRQLRLAEKESERQRIRRILKGRVAA